MATASPLSLQYFFLSNENIVCYDRSKKKLSLSIGLLLVLVSFEVIAELLKGGRTVNSALKDKISKCLQKECCIEAYTKATDDLVENYTNDWCAYAMLHLHTL